MSKKVPGVIRRGKTARRITAMGMPNAFLRHWAPAWASSWVVAFPVILLVGPIIRKAVARVVEPPPSR